MSFLRANAFLRDSRPHKQAFDLFGRFCRRHVRGSFDRMSVGIAISSNPPTLIISDAQDSGNHMGDVSLDCGFGTLQNGVHVVYVAILGILKGQHPSVEQLRDRHLSVLMNLDSVGPVAATRDDSDVMGHSVVKRGTFRSSIPGLCLAVTGNRNGGEGP